MNLSAALRATVLGAATGMRSMTGLAAVALTTPRGARPAWVGRLGGGWGRGLTSLAAVGELLTDKSGELPSRLESPVFGQRLTMGAVNATALAKREGARPVLPALLAVAGAAAGTYLGVRWRTYAQHHGRATAGAVVEDLAAIGLAAAATRRAKGVGMNPASMRRESPIRPAGEGKGAWLASLEQGANLLQQATPLKDFDVYVVGFHPAKDDPNMQMEAHHYCRVVNDDLIQCVLFDGNTRDANLIGVEYIVSQRLFEALPEPERSYWHPHNFEILSAQLVAPGLPDAAEKALMRRLLNGYGKTWHTWHTGRHDGEAGHDLPLGEPMLMWSFNRERECDESLKQHRNRAMGIDVDKKYRDRQALVALAHPQWGVDELKDQFVDTEPIAGVVDVPARASRADTPAAATARDS
jgi:uncharacterized membrane protein